MFQTVQGRNVYVVDLTEGLPDLPITPGDDPALTPYAMALDIALRDGTITEPGKYAIELSENRLNYVIFRVDE